MVESHQTLAEGQVSKEDTSLAPVARRATETQKSVHQRAMNILNGWDRGIDNASERIGDAMSAGFRTFWKQLFIKKKSSSSPEKPSHTVS